MQRIISTSVALILLGSAAVACPDPESAASNTYDVAGEALQVAQTFSVTAGGENPVLACGDVQPSTDRGEGFFAIQPDFAFDFSGLAGFGLEISASSDCDTVLLINTSSSNWYYDDDDSGDDQPQIVLTKPVDGQIQIWVGTYDGAYCNAQLKLETFSR